MLVFAHLTMNNLADAWEDTEEVSLGDTNGKGGWNTAAAAPSGSSDKDIKVCRQVCCHVCCAPCMYQKREKELNKREKELAKKEEDLRRREEAVAAAGGVVKEVKNWPRCFPIIHHDIDGDIGPNFARAVKAAWITFWVRGEQEASCHGDASLTPRALRLRPRGT